MIFDTEDYKKAYKMDKEIKLKRNHGDLMVDTKSCLFCSQEFYIQGKKKFCSKTCQRTYHDLLKRNKDNIDSAIKRYIAKKQRKNKNKKTENEEIYRKKTKYPNFVKTPIFKSDYIDHNETHIGILKVIEYDPNVDISDKYYCYLFKEENRDYIYYKESRKRRTTDSIYNLDSLYKLWEDSGIAIFELM